MKRKAFLIGSPFIEGKPNYLQGVTPDILNMKSHLLSLNGGAWNEEEILIFENPTKIELSNAMTGTYDFVIVQYSGHGFEYTDHGTQIDINPNEYLSLEEMHRWINAQRRYYFLDCCRGVVKRVEKSIQSFSMDSMLESRNRRPEYRKKYEDVIESCETGLSVIYSCGLNESADEDDSGKGGIFTVSYFKAAAKLSPAESDKYFSIKTVFEKGKEIMDENYPLNTQSPTMKPERRNRYFPFVI
jgi:hypothetical protein